MRYGIHLFREEGPRYRFIAGLAPCFSNYEGMFTGDVDDLNYVDWQFDGDLFLAVI